MKAIFLLLITVAVGILLWFRVEPLLRERGRMPSGEVRAFGLCRDWLPVIEDTIRLENAENRADAFRSRIASRMSIYEEGAARPVRELAVHCLFPERMASNTMYVLVAVEYTRTNAPLGVIVYRNGKCYATMMGRTGVDNMPLGKPSFFVGR